MNCLSKPLFSSPSLINSFMRRPISTISVLETDIISVKFPTYPRNPIPPRVDLKAKNVHWIFLGVPGVRKGTYANRLCSILGVRHITTGDLVREELNSTGPLSVLAHL